MSAISAVLFKAGTNVEPEPVVVDGLGSIQSWVGGNVETVHISAQKRDSDDSFDLIGYCDDEGLVKDLEMNWLASALFRQEIRGNVVVVGDVGNGEIGDVPDTFVQWLTHAFLERVADSYNQASLVAAIMEYAVENNLIPKDEIMEVLKAMNGDIDNGEQTGETIQKLNDLLEKLLKAVQLHTADEDGAELVSEIEQFLKTETEK